MPRRSYIAPSLLLLSLLLNACLQTTIEFSGAAIPPKKSVLKARINATSSASDSSLILISNTKFIFGSDPDPRYTHEAELLLYADGELLPPCITKGEYTLNYIIDSIASSIQAYNVPAYRVSHPFAPGQRIKLVVSRPDYPTATAEGTIPAQAEIKQLDVDFGQYQSDNGEEKGYKTTLTLRNPSSELSYFRIRLISRTPVFDFLSFGGENNFLGTWESDHPIYIADEPAFSDLQGLLSSNVYPPNCYVFTNALFAQALDYTLTLSLPHAVPIPGATYYFVLENINEDSYRYYLSLMKEQNTNGMFGEPVIRYSNVRNGIGIMHLCTDDRRLVQFPTESPLPPKPTPAP